MAKSAYRILAASIGLALGVCSYSASASISQQAVLNGSVSDTVTQTGPSSWDYQFSVANSVPSGPVPPGLILSLVVPYFADAVFTNITDPASWTHSVINVSPFHDSLTKAYPSVTQELVWSTQGAPIMPGQSLSGFGFTAAYGPVKGPYMLAGTGYPQVIDPPIPGSPNTIAAGFTQSLAPIPEPETYALMLAGLGLLGFMARRRK